MDYERVLGFCLIVAPLGCALLYYTPKFWECKNDVDGNLTKLLSKTTINETLPSLSSLEFEDESHFKATPFSPCFSPLENLPSSSSSSSFSGTSLKLSKKVIVKSTHPPPPQTFRKKKRIPGSLKKFIENTETSTLSSSDTTISISSSSSDAPVVVIAAANRQADHEQQILDLKTQLHLQATKLVSCQEYIESETARHDAEIKELKIEFLQSQLKCATALGELEDAKEMNQQLNYTIKLLMKSMNNISCSNSLTKFQASTLEEKGNGDIKDDFVPSLTPSLPLAVAKKRHRKPKHSDIPMAAE